jgi:exosortase
VTKSRNSFYFISLLGLSVILWWHALASTLKLALQNYEYTHIFLILPISAALIYLEWTSGTLPQANIRNNSALLLLPVLAGLATSQWWGIGRLSRDAQLSLEMLTLVGWWIASFVCCFGTRVAQRCLFPLSFLLWFVPLPEFAVAGIIRFLQQGSASSAQLLFTMARVPVAQDGVFLSIPGLTIEVATECSSIRSTLILLVTGMVLAHLLLGSGWGKTLLTLAVIPISVIKNGLRIFTITMLGTRVDPGFLHGRLHRQGGILFYLLSLVVLFLLLLLLQRLERKQKPETIPAPIVRDRTKLSVNLS